MCRRMLVKAGPVTLLSLLAMNAQAGDWTKFAGDRSLTGTVRDAIFKGSNVGGLAIQWQANTGGAVSASPVAKYFPSIGKTLVFIGNNSRMIAAYDAATGDRVWYLRTGATVYSTPVIWGNSVWVGGQDRYLRKLNALTGELECQYVSPGGITSSPLITDPDGAGPATATIYFGDAGLAGADDGGHVTAVDVADCKEKWRFSGYGPVGAPQPLAGTWSPISFAPPWGGGHPPLILFGGSSPDNAVYAINAITGNAATNVPLWRLQAAQNINDLDVGAGVTAAHVRPATPGGVGFVSAKNSVMRAIDLNDGKQIWEYDVLADSPGNYHVRSTAAYLPGRIIFGYGYGLYALNATTGAKIWKTADFQAEGHDVLASPAISFPSGSRIGDAAIFYGDVHGRFHAVNGAGREVWSYDTGGPIFASAALTEDRIFVGSGDGFLYAFGLGGGVSAKPDTVISSPSGSTVPHPGVGADLTVSGSASDDRSVSRVLVAIQDTSTGRWWDAATRTWVPVFMQAEVATSPSAGGSNVTWQTKFPIATAGGRFYVQAEAVDSDAQHDAEVAQARFTVPTLGNPPDAAFTYPAVGQNPLSRFPNGRNVYPITVTGTATDTRGANPGVQRVYVEVRNSDHNEYYCGPAGCPGLPEGTLWQPQWAQIEATLSNPGGTSTEWSIVFPTYDHPHNYRFRVKPVDRDGETSQGWIDGGKICVRDPGPVTDCYRI